MRSVLALSTIILLLSGCAHVAGSKGPPKELGGENVYYGTQVAVGKCPESPEGGVFAVVAASAIAKGVSRVGDAIKAAGAKKTVTTLANRNVELRTSAGIGNCIIVARGWFHRNIPAYRDPPAPSSAYYANPKSAFPAKDAQMARTFWRMGIYIAASPDFYFKGNLINSTSKSAYTVFPREATMDEPISSNILRPSDKRHVLVAFALSDAGSSADLEKASGTTIVLGAMEPGKLISYAFEPCQAWDSSYPNPAIAEITKVPQPTCVIGGDFDILTRSPFESNWFKVEASDKPKPMLLQALVSETQSPSKFLEFVGEVFSDSSKSITDELQKSWIPSLAQAEEDAEKAAEAKALKEYDTALAKAFTDLSACVDKPTDIAKRISARISVREALASANKVSPPPSVLTRNIDPASIKNEDGTKDACEAIANLLKSP